MKFFDIVIYIFLILFGVSIGWYLRGTNANQEKPEPQKSVKVEVTKSKKNPRASDYTSVSAPDTSHDFEPVNKVEAPKNEISDNREIISSHSEVANRQQNKVAETQRLLLLNDFEGALSVMVSCKGNTSDESALVESSTLIANFMHTKILNKDHAIILPQLDKALFANSGWWPLIALKGKALIALGDFEEGANSLSKEMFYLVHEKEIKELETLVRFLRSKRIEQLKQQKLFHRLIEYYEELIIADSAYALYYYDLGRLYAEKYDFDSALIMLKIIITDETYGVEAEALIAQIEIAKEVEANRLAIKLENRNSLQIPIVRVNDRIFINAVLNGKTSSKLLVDTGATISVISVAHSAKLGYTAKELTEMRWFQTAGGRVRKPVVPLTQLTVGEITMQNFLVAVSKEVGIDYDGILGMNFLGRFNFEINSDRSLLILTSK